MIDVLPDVEPLPPLPPLPPNSAAIAAIPAQDGVHSIIRIMYDATHLSEDGQKLLLYMLTNALVELEKGIKSMSRIEVAAKLAQRERIKALRENGK